jgi:DNA adenine methylase
MSRYKTPLRYPGGKQKLTPFILEILRKNDLVGGTYVEPFAGGAGVAMELLLGNHVSAVHLNDLSRPIYAFWRAVLFETDQLCRRIASASLTVEEWRRQKAILARPSKASQLELAFSLFYLNRCNRSGITTGGLIGGLHQSGEWTMDARFPRTELIHRVEAIANKRRAITVKNMDAEVYLKQHVSSLPKNTLVYCDPPYFHKANRLYLNHYEPDDHAYIAQVIQKHLRRPWIVSYDNAHEIVDAYSKRRRFSYSLQYNAGTVYKGTEVFFFSDNLKVPDESAVACINKALARLPKVMKKRFAIR